MGASQSSSKTRSVSMENPTPSGVIDISDDVVARLKKSFTQQHKENEVAATKVETRAVPVKTAEPAKTKVVYSQQPTTVYVPAGGATMTGMDMRRQKEIELKQNDAMWRQRMQQLELNLKKTNTIMESEYSTAVEDVRKRFATAAPSHQLPPCQDLKAKVIGCYRSNPGETLKCANEVAAFRSCVNMNRIAKLQAAEDAEKVTASKAASKVPKAA